MCANSAITANLAISDGCSVPKPRFIQRFAPLYSEPMTSTRTSSTMESAIRGRGKAVQNMIINMGDDEHGNNAYRRVKHLRADKFIAVAKAVIPAG